MDYETMSRGQLLREIRSLRRQREIEMVERKEIEDTLRSSQEASEAIMNASRESIFLIDITGRILSGNAAGAGRLGAERSEVIGRCLFDYFPEKVARARRMRVEEVVRSGQPVQFEDERAGRRYDITLYPVFSGARYVSGLVIYASDVTERRRSEEALRESEEKYRTVVEQSNDGVVIIQDGIVKYANRRMAELHEEPLESVMGASMTDRIHPDDIAKVTDKYARRLAGEEVPATYEVRITGGNNTYIQTELSVGIVTYHGRPATLVTIRDITQRKNMEEELRKSRDELEIRVQGRTAELMNAYLALRTQFDALTKAQTEMRQMAAIAESAPEAVAVCDISWKIRYVNPAFARMTGYRPEEAIGRDLSLLRSDETDGNVYDRVREELMESGSGAGRFLQRRKDGTNLPVEAVTCFIKNPDGNITGLVYLWRDMSEQVGLEEALRQSQKMEAIGTLAGGIAHDFNNVLAIILGNAELALDGLNELDHTDDARKNMDNIIKASIRARDLVRQILTFSRRGKQERSPVKLAPLIRETFKLLRGSLPSTIDMVLDVKTQSDGIRADPSQIQQILINLSTNAAHAMKQKGGVLTIGLCDVTFGAGQPVPHPEMSAGRYAKLWVSDTGVGMTDKVRQRIFEPFFTTRRRDGGSGMGLAVVYGIVGGHNGRIVVDSEPGKGSTFAVFLPSANTHAPDRWDNETISNGSEKILLVDDELEVVNVNSKLLKSLGYDVTPALGGLEAMKIFLKDPDGFDLVVTDQTMPNLTGITLARRMLQVRKDIPIILVTGYRKTVWHKRAKAVGIRELITKPLTRGEMAETIRKAISNQG